MFNLVKLEWTAIKAHHWRIALMALLLVAMGLMGLYVVIIPMSVLMIAIFSTNTFAVEESGKLDCLYMSLPVSRKDIVRGRYALALIMLALGLLLTVTVVTLAPEVFVLSGISLPIANIGLTGCLLLTCVSITFFAFINLCTYPFLFKLGYTKGKIFGYYIPLGLILVAVCLLTSLSLFEFVNIPTWMSLALDNPILVSFILLDAGAFMLVVSYKLSLWQFGKRSL
jgi:ABC-type transport system involved in multi-copper enzyme maturation permease subunit